LIGKADDNNKDSTKPSFVCPYVGAQKRTGYGDNCCYFLTLMILVKRERRMPYSHSCSFVFNYQYKWNISTREREREGESRIICWLL